MEVSRFDPEIVVEFDSEEAAMEFESFAWSVIVENALGSGETAKNSKGELVENLDGYTQKDIAGLKICGHLAGALCTDNGSTISYATVKKAYNADKVCPCSDRFDRLILLLSYRFTRFLENTGEIMI